MSTGPILHPWDLSVREAIALQREVASAVERRDRFGEVRTIAGIDVAYGRRGRNANARAAAVLMDAATLEVLERSAIEMAITFPYVPGLLTFREAPPAIAAIRALRRRPDLLLCDGQGLAHPGAAVSPATSRWRSICRRSARPSPGSPARTTRRERNAAHGRRCSTMAR